MNLFHLLRPVVVLLVAAGLVTFSSRASAEERDYHLHGTALLDEFGNVVGAGNATHLGNYTEVGYASITGDNPFALHVEGCVILTGAHGDELWETISGQLNWFTGEITATVTYIGGTGRFEGASGSAILLAQIGPDGISVVVDGTIDY
jgi:hypothetical protein